MQTKLFKSTKDQKNPCKSFLLSSHFSMHGKCHKNNSRNHKIPNGMFSKLNKKLKDI